MTGPSPLVGSPLHKALLALQEAEAQFAEDTRDSFEAAGQLSAATGLLSDCIKALKAELNRRHLQMRRAKPALNEPAAPMIELRMPGKDNVPVMFAKTGRGIRAMFDWVAASINDGGSTILLCNVDLFTRLSKAGFEKEVEALRAAAREALVPAGED
jgi:hypothetical protein